MAIKTVTMRTALAAAYGTAAPIAALYTTVPTGTAAGTEVTGGTYARKPLTWSSASASATSVTAVFDVPQGTTVRGAGVHKSDGTYMDGDALRDSGGNAIEQFFATDGQYTLTISFTEA